RRPSPAPPGHEGPCRSPRGRAPPARGRGDPRSPRRDFLGSSWPPAPLPSSPPPNPSAEWRDQLEGLLRRAAFHHLRLLPRLFLRDLPKPRGHCEHRTPLAPPAFIPL